MQEKYFSKKIEEIPNKCGVYLMKGFKGSVIYIGKATSLKKRVTSYFTKYGNFSQKTMALISSIRNLDYIVTRNEKEALILENELIKYFHPKYNISYRDDKTYPYLKLTIKEKFPKLLITRKVIRNGSRYFGPYPDGSSLRRVLRTIHRIFPFVKCNPSFFKKIEKKKNPSSCLDFNMGQCLAPCVGKITKEEYKEIIGNVILFLSGKKGNLLEKLSRAYLCRYDCACASPATEDSFPESVL